MNRREFLKSMLIMAGACSLGLIRPAPPMVQLIVTDPQGKVTSTIRPLHVITGVGEVWHTENIFDFDSMPVWEKGALPTRFFCNPRIAGRMASFIERAWG